MAKSVYEILVKLQGDKEAIAKLEKLESGLREIGQAIALSGAALTAVSGLAGKAAADYEKQLAKVSTVSGEATGSTAELDQQFDKLTVTLDNTMTKTQSAAAAYDVLSSGYTKQADILGILERSQKAAVGGFSDIGTVSDATTSIMNSYGDALMKGASATEKATAITDQMIQVQNAGKIVVSEYASMIGQVAPTAALAGMSLTEVNAAIATTTANGLPAESAIAGLGMAISNILGPTSVAKQEAKRLGIEFDAAALKTKGLKGILEQLNSLNLTSDQQADSLNKLFGSIQGFKVAANLSGANLDKFAANIDLMANSAGSADKAFTTMSQTFEGRATASLNKLQDSILKLGQGVLVATAPAIEALNFLVDNFNKLPAPIQTAIGSFTVIAGVTLTLSGAALMLAAQMLSLGAAIGKVAAFSTTLLPALTSAATGISSYTAATVSAAMATGGLGAAIAVVAGPITLAVAAVGSLAAAWMHYNNIVAEGKNETALKNLQLTEQMTQKAVALGIQIKQTGKALPEAEFNNFISQLKTMDGGTGSLKSTIEALTRTQEGAKKATTDQVVASGQAAKASGQVTDATKDQEQATKDAMKAEQEFMAANESRFAETEQGYQQDVANAKAAAIAKGTDQKTLNTELLNLEQSYVAKKIENLRMVATSDKVTKQSQLKAETEIAQLQLGLAEKRKQIKDQEAADDKRKADEQLQRIKENFKNQEELLRAQHESEVALDQLAAYQSGATEEQMLAQKLKANQEYNSNLIKLKQQEIASGKFTATEKAALESDINQLLLANAKELSDYKQSLDELDVKRRKATLDSALAQERLAFLQKTQSESDYQRDTQQLKEKAAQDDLQRLQNLIDQSKQGSVQRLQLEAEYYQKSVEYQELLQQKAKETTEKNLDNLRLLLSSSKAEIENTMAAFGTADSFLSGTSSYLSGISGVLSDIGGSLKDENTSSQQRNQLLSVAQNLYGQLAGQGIEIVRGKTAEQTLQNAQNALELAQLDIKRQQIRVQLEQLSLEQETKTLELQSTIEEQRLLLQSGTLSDQETKKAQLELNLAQRKLGLVAKETEIKSRNLQLDYAVAMAQTQIKEVKSGINPLLGANTQFNKGTNINETAYIKGSDQAIPASMMSQPVSKLVGSVPGAQSAVLPNNQVANPEIQKYLKPPSEGPSLFIDNQSLSQLPQLLKTVADKVDKVTEAIDRKPVPQVPRSEPGLSRK